VTAQNPMRGDVAALVAAAGMGTRLGPGAPKALRELGGASLLEHAVARLAQAPSVGLIVVAAPAEHVDALRSRLTAHVRVEVVGGGPTRQASVAAALAAVPPSFGYVVVHDAARAFAPPELIERVAAALREGHRAVIPVLDVVDTVKQVDETGHVVATLDRSCLRSVQTPQGFHRDVLVAAHARADVSDVTDDAGLAERIGVPVYCVPGAEAALKITRPADLDRAELLLSQANNFASGGGSGGRTLQT
jgi:2-C-methyl-D-erythritol 4-phosphate cytidylyltransferase